MKHLGILKLSTLMAAAVWTLVACGGSGSSAPVSNASLTQKVATAVQNGFRAQQSSATSNPVPGSRVDDGDGETGPSFDSVLQVWIKVVENGYEYYLDREFTQRAGQSLTTTRNEGNFTEVRTNVTAGPQNGFESLMEYGIENGVFIVRYSGSSPISGPFTFNVTNNDGVVQYSATYRDEDGVNRNYAVSYTSDGTSTVSYNNPQDFQYTLNYAADGSGTGTVTGSSAQLPATVTWDVNGDGKIVFADATEIQFRGFDFSF